ncbi:hypothetical protein, partial [Streptomyces hydrogenans]|uniref:hypothetical protein n=1 Tax=Streptomyces hydrogenans TaxID=1873719 RepID=UPI001E2C1635
MRRIRARGGQHSVHRSTIATSAHMPLHQFWIHCNEIPALICTDAIPVQRSRCRTLESNVAFLMSETPTERTPAGAVIMQKFATT